MTESNPLPIFIFIIGMFGFIFVSLEFYYPFWRYLIILFVYWMLVFGLALFAEIKLNCNVLFYPKEKEEKKND